MVDDWIKIDEVEITSEINCIHCDTRIFHAKCNIIDFKKIENDRYYELTYNKFIDFLEEKKGNIDEKYLININEIIPFLLNLREIKNYANEPILRFNDVLGCGFWLKYVRMYKINDNQFIVCNSDCVPIEWRLLSKNNVTITNYENK